MKMLVVGLTGGIGSGKSTVSHLFESLAVPVIDMDVIAREVTRPGSDTLQLICEHFGDDILFEDGTLNRKKLRQIIFKSEKNRRLLESILHPAIRQKTLEALERLADKHTPYCIVVIPLLAESSEPFPVDRILVVDTSEALQLQRTCKRDGITEQAARDIMSSQVSRNERLNIADDIIENNANLESIQATVKRLHHKYLELARSK